VNILSLESVLKKYQTKTAVDNVSFVVPKGSIFGLLGPNGAGKTSIIRIITSITRADSGIVLFNDEVLNAKHRMQIGYMPEERGLYKKMKVGEQLTYLSRLKGLSKKEAKDKIEYWYQKFDISSWHHKKVEELSKGMQQKIQFIATIIHDPLLLILDEPFSGLDPVNANLIRDEILELKNKGTSIIFSTHRMEQVEQICEEIVLINYGTNVLNGKVADIKQQFKEHLFEVEFIGNYNDSINSLAVPVSISTNKAVLKLNEGINSNKLLTELISKEIEIVSFREILPSLNEIFIKTVQK
jgi:ABC-2 type transport system ATP-binding protein